MATLGAKLELEPPRMRPRNRDPLIHAGCGGTFIFLKPEREEAGIPDERVCSVCRKKETYEPGRLLLIGRPGVSSEALIRFYKKYQERMKKLPGLEAGDAESLPEPTIMTSAHSTLAVLIVTIPGAEKEGNPETFLDMLIAREEWSELIWAACRKPITR